MKPFLKSAMACLLSLTLILSTGCGRAIATARATTPEANLTQSELQALLERPFVDVFDYASQRQVSGSQIADYEKALNQQEKQEERRLKALEKQLKNQLGDARDQLKDFNEGKLQNVSQPEQTRHRLACRVQQLERELQKTEVARRVGVDNQFDAKEAKLKVLDEWPERHAALQKMSREEHLQDMKFSDFRRIGSRGGVFENQADDVAIGQRVMSELMAIKALPPQVEDRMVNDYVQSLGDRIARNSDLNVPLRVIVLQNKEINAMALPGGYLLVNTGLIAKAEKESELAGVLAHEIAHSAARHGNRLQRRANWFNLLFGAAQIAAMIFTGGTVGLGTAYALEYGFQALGLVLSLNMLGVSRDYEIEADILGTQYLWNSRYNTRGFMSFFDKMAQETGYVDGASWFRTHPPFYERMQASYEQIVILPNPRDVVDDTAEFHRIKQRVQALNREAERRDRNAPSLQRQMECEDGEDHLQTSDVTARRFALQYSGCGSAYR